MPYIDHYVSVTDAKNHLLDLLRKLKGRQEVLAITRDGVPTAVLLSMEQYNGLMETIELLGDRQAMRSIKRSLKQAAAGRWISHESVFGRNERGPTAFVTHLKLQSGCESSTPKSSGKSAKVFESYSSPRLSGHPLQLELSGYRSYRIRTYRIVYQIKNG